MMKRNERDWAGQLISWIQEAIRDGRTVFEDATNDTGIKLESGRTKFPDILLFTDKLSGVVFNGWELKFPDTPVDDRDMLENALEKAKKLKSDSFVTWNGAEAVIWKIEDENYTLEALSKIKEYPKEKAINNRDDLAIPTKFICNELLLRTRANEILHDLGHLYENNELKHSINISGSIVEAIIEASEIILPQLQQAIGTEKRNNTDFRREYNKWKIYESSTLKILSSSSRNPENLIEEEVLARFTFYNLVGKILFYLILSENLTGELNRIYISSSTNIKQSLEAYFEDAQRIDYQAIFKPCFTDSLPFSNIINDTIFQLMKVFTEFDFRVLPTGVIGTILENLVPQSEKQKFGQYFTSEMLSNLVAFPAIQTADDYVFDPTSGTGTFLSSSYKILKYFGKKDHSELLRQIWGNDISHFPAILSVINLYRQDVFRTDNFPRITRDDFFNLNPGDLVCFPDSKDFTNQIELSIPEFDVLVSNFPFIQQEDIPNGTLTTFFRKKFEASQQAFLQDSTFKINERSDYFTYCVYNAIRFLKKGGYLAAITSNAWLGKEYGDQFKKFLLDNFHIKYIIKSNAEHWFSDSKVSTVYAVIKRGASEEPTKFVTLNFKLKDKLDKENTENQLKQIEDLYAQIDYCNDKKNINWTSSTAFNDLYISTDKSMTVCVVPRVKLLESLHTKENWAKYFLTSELFANFDKHLSILYPDVVGVFRGERTGWNKMFIIPETSVADTGIEEKFLLPYIKSPDELHALTFSGNYKHRLFVCSLPLDELKKKYSGAYRWIKKHEKRTNKNGTKTIAEACKAHKPFWYTLKPNQVNIITAINPYQRYFFCFSEKPLTIDQRLVAIDVKGDWDVELILALLNSIVTFLSIEMKGTSRNLGALDLNANDFKTLPILNPHSLNEVQRIEIVDSFQPLKQRSIMTVYEEVRAEDRIHFDKTIFRCYGIDENILDGLYQILASFVYDRVKLKEK